MAHAILNILNQSQVEVGLSPQQLKKIFVYCMDKTCDTDEFISTLSQLKTLPAIELLFCDDSQMRQFQKQYRNLDRTTDVLSFPATERLAPGEMAIHWGELIVSLPTVKRHAKSYGRSFKAELVEVLVHGWLHILGFDHVGSRAEAKMMLGLQAQLSPGAMKAIRNSHVSRRSRVAKKSQRS